MIQITRTLERMDTHKIRNLQHKAKRIKARFKQPCTRWCKTQLTQQKNNAKIERENQEERD